MNYLDKRIRLSHVLLPFLCVLAAYRTIFTYYIWLFPTLEGLFNTLYIVATFIFLLLFPCMLLYIIIHRLYLGRIKGAIFIVIAVLVNIIYVVISSGNTSIISRSFINTFAFGTNDVNGYYFAQINTWFGNVGLLLAAYIFIKDKKTLNNCIMALMWVFLIPTIITLIFHPEFIGQRESSISGLIFGGGLWNIGVIGFGSFSWLIFAQLNEFKRINKIILIISVVLFISSGLFGLSRTLIVMMVVSIGYYLIKRKKNKNWLFVVVSIAVIFGLFCLVESSVWDEILGRLTDATSGTSNVRLLLWTGYLGNIKEYWLLGAPIGSVYRYYKGVTYATHNYLPHSAIINFLCRFGIIAVMGYISILFQYFFGVNNSTSASRRKRIILQSGCIAYMALAFINQTGYEESIFWITFGLIFALIKIENKLVGDIRK
jgi:hypothetical protein